MCERGQVRHQNLLTIIARISVKHLMTSSRWAQVAGRASNSVTVMFSLGMEANSNPTHECGKITYTTTEIRSGRHMSEKRVAKDWVETVAND